MAVRYSEIIIHTSEEARHGGQPLHAAVVDRIHRLHAAARCMVTRGIAGCYESGEIASQRLEVLSYNMPIRVDIVLPTAAVAEVMPLLDELVTDGIVLTRELQLQSHRVKGRAVPRHLRVRDVMTTAPTTVSPETSLRDALRLLLTSGLRGLPVVDAEGRPMGIVTQGDLVERAGLPLRLGLLQELEEPGVDELLDPSAPGSIRDIMSTPAVTVPADGRLTDAVALMVTKGLKRLPVIGKDGKLTGVLSRIDVFRTITREAADWTHEDARAVVVTELGRVRDVMDREVRTVGPDTPLSDVVAGMGEPGAQRVAVTDDDGRLLGLVTDRDLLPMLLGPERTRSPWTIARLLGRRSDEAPVAMPDDLAGRRVGEVMLTDLVRAHEDDLIVDAVRVMSEYGLKRLPVVDANGIFRGMISREAVLRAEKTAASHTERGEGRESGE